MPLGFLKRAHLTPKALLWYLRALAAIYLVSGLSHWAFLIGATGGRFEDASIHLQSATVYFALIEVVAAVGLWSGAAWGVAAWLLAAVAQMALHLGYADLFGIAWGVVIFHALSIIIYVGLAWWTGAPENTTEVFRLPPD